MGFPIDTRRSSGGPDFTGADVESSRLQAGASAFGSTISSGATSWVGRKLGEAFRGPETEFVTPEQAEEAFMEATGIYGMTRQDLTTMGLTAPTYDRNVGRKELDSRVASFGREFAHQRMISRAPESKLTSAAVLVGSMVGDTLDPINLGAMFATPYIAMSAKFIKIASVAKSKTMQMALKSPARARLNVGAAGGAFGNIVTEPFYAAQAEYKGVAPQTVADSVINIAAGTMLGAGLHVAGGAIGDALAGPTGGLKREAQDHFSRMTGVERGKIRRMALEGSDSELEDYLSRNWDSSITARDIMHGSNVLTTMVTAFEAGNRRVGDLFKRLTALDVGVRKGDIAPEEALAVANKLVQDADIYGVNPRTQMEAEGIDFEGEIPTVEELDALRAQTASDRHPHLGDEKVDQLEFDLDAVTNNEEEIKDLLRASFLCYEPVRKVEGQMELDLPATGHQERFDFEPVGDEITVERAMALREQGHLQTIQRPDADIDGPEQMELDLTGPAPEQMDLPLRNVEEQLEFDLGELRKAPPEVPEQMDLELPYDPPDQLPLGLQEQTEIPGLEPRAQITSVPVDAELRSLLEAKTVRELRALAKANDVPVKSRARKPEILDTLAAHGELSRESLDNIVDLEGYKAQKTAPQDKALEDAWVVIEAEHKILDEMGEKIEEQWPHFEQTGERSPQEEFLRARYEKQEAKLQSIIEGYQAQGLDFHPPQYYRMDAEFEGPDLKNINDSFDDKIQNLHEQIAEVSMLERDITLAKTEEDLARFEEQLAGRNVEDLSKQLQEMQKTQKDLLSWEGGDPAEVRDFEAKTPAVGTQMDLPESATVESSFVQAGASREQMEALHVGIRQIEAEEMGAMRTQIQTESKRLVESHDKYTNVRTKADRARRRSDDHSKALTRIYDEAPLSLIDDGKIDEWVSRFDVAYKREMDSLDMHPNVIGDDEHDAVLGIFQLKEHREYISGQHEVYKTALTERKQALQERFIDLLTDTEPTDG